MKPKDVNRFLLLWSLPIEEGEPPLRFSDELSYSMFATSLHGLLKAEYKRGVKAEKRRAKCAAVRRWKAKQK